MHPIAWLHNPDMDADVFYAGVIEKYSKHVNPYLGRLMAFAGFGVEMRGEGCEIFDHEGRAFLDFLGGYGCFSLGHRHPRVIAAVKDQLDTLPLSGKAFFSAKAADLAEKLAHISPEGLEYTFFCNSGTEAVEGALKLAKGSTGRAKIVSTDNSYHGKTLGALATTGREKYRTPFLPLMPGVEFVPFGDAQAARAALDDQTACFIVEPVQGEGGVIVPPPGYLNDLREACDRVGALLIADEVQTGFGRTGKMFGSNHDGVVPDLMTFAKCLGGGVMPIGAVHGTSQVWDGVFGKNPLAHTSTFGGNPLACSAGLATIAVIEDEGLIERSERMGSILLRGLRDVANRHADTVREVRGQGLMIGFEFREDEVGELVVASLLKRGVCVAYTLNNARVLRFEPPLIIEQGMIDRAVEALDEAVTETKELLAMVV